MEREYFPALLLLLLLVPLVARSGSSVGSEVHDVAITHVTAWPNLTLPSYVHVNVSVENQGAGRETFNVAIHANNLAVTLATVADLAPGSSKTLKFRCDLFPFREVIFQPLPWPLDEPMVVNVTIWAEVGVVAGEVDTADNVYVDGTVSIVWWVLDLNGDGRINILDLAIMARAFGGGGFHPLWDFNRDGTVDIREIAYLVKFFGWVYYESSNPDDP